MGTGDTCQVSTVHYRQQRTYVPFSEMRVGCVTHLSNICIALVVVVLLPHAMLIPAISAEAKMGGDQQCFTGVDPVALARESVKRNPPRFFGMAATSQLTPAVGLTRAACYPEAAVQMVGPTSDYSDDSMECFRSRLEFVRRHNLLVREYLSRRRWGRCPTREDWDLAFAATNRVMKGVGPECYVTFDPRQVEPSFSIFMPEYRYIQGVVEDLCGVISGSGILRPVTLKFFERGARVGEKPRGKVTCESGFVGGADPPLGVVDSFDKS